MEQAARARKRLPEVQARIRQKLAGRVGELEAQADKDRLEQELVYLAQKMDVDEELTAWTGMWPKCGGCWSVTSRSEGGWIS